MNDKKKCRKNTNTPLICDDGFDVDRYIEWKNSEMHGNDA